MFRLEVTGATLQELYTDSTNLLLLIARGGQNIAPTPEAPQQSQSVADVQAPGEAAAAVVAEPNPSVAPTPPPRKKKPGGIKAVTIENFSMDDPVMHPDDPKRFDPKATAVDEDPLGLDTPSPETKPELTLQNMRERVQAILEAGKARGTEYSEMVVYVRKLFAPFGIKTAAELKPERFDEFWERSQAYLDGTAT